MTSKILNQKKGRAENQKQIKSLIETVKTLIAFFREFKELVEELKTEILRLIKKIVLIYQNHQVTIVIKGDNQYTAKIRK